MAGQLHSHNNPDPYLNLISFSLYESLPKKANNEAPLFDLLQGAYIHVVLRPSHDASVPLSAESTLRELFKWCIKGQSDATRS